MGLFSVTSSFAEPTAGGGVRFTPAPPDPRWMRAIEAVSWVVPPILVVATFASGDLDLLILVIGAFWLLAAFSFIAARIAGRGNPSPPTEPFDVPPPLVAELRRLAADGQDTEAMRRVGRELGVGLLASRQIVDAAAGR